MALAVQKRFPHARLQIWARRSAAFAGIAAKGIDAHCTIDAVDAASGADLIILATPIDAMPDLARQIVRAELPEHVVVTDVGSVKGSVVAALEPILGHRFVGSHPMAGSEKTGIETARGDLFERAACLLTPTQATDPARLQQLKEFWLALGCRVFEFNPDDHDQKVARISHLPHLMAAVTALAAVRADPGAMRCAANGFRDTTRVAGGDPNMWTGIVMENRVAIVERLREAATTLTDLLEILEKPDEEALRRFLAEAKTLRDQAQAGV